MSTSTRSRQSSGSEGVLGIGIDERKRKRMISNRESARRSRMRKQQLLNDLIRQTAQLKNENSNMAKQIEIITQRYSSVEVENVILRSQVMELKEKLEGLNSVLYIFKERNGMALEIPEIPDQLLEPWQVPYLEPWQVPYPEIPEIPDQLLEPWQVPCPEILLHASASEYFPAVN